jgi:hypothetical protein
MAAVCVVDVEWTSVEQPTEPARFPTDTRCGGMKVAATVAWDVPGRSLGPKHRHLHSHCAGVIGSRNARIHHRHC